MRTIFSYLAVAGMLLLPLAACGEDALFNKIKDTENFKNADAVFVGKVTEVEEQLPPFCEPVNGQSFKPANTNRYAQVEIKKIYKGDAKIKTTAFVSYSYLWKKESQPILEKGRQYLVFAQSKPYTGNGFFVVNNYRFEIKEYYFVTSPEMGTIKLK